MYIWDLLKDNISKNLSKNNRLDSHIPLGSPGIRDFVPNSEKTAKHPENVPIFAFLVHFPSFAFFSVFLAENREKRPENVPNLAFLGLPNF